MRQSVRRWLFSAGAVVAVGASACGQAGTASAAGLGPLTPAGHEAAATTASKVVATPAAYVPPSHDLYFGDKGAAVKSVQERLTQLGYYAGPADGEYGQDLAEAVWAFKEVQGLPMTAASNTIITYRFRRDLIRPRAPKVLVPRGGANRIEINQNDEVLVLYRNNKPHLMIHVSTGGGYTYPCPGDPGATCGPAITPDGNFTALSFAPGWIQVPLGTMYNPVFFIGGAYAIHGDIPVPLYAASHGCVRIPMGLAGFFHKLIHISQDHGTPIYIRGRT